MGGTMKRKTLVSICVALLAASSVGGCATRQQDGLSRIEHIVVLYAENRSFDHLYGLFPGAEGLAQATPEQKTQLDHDGRPLPHLPPVYDGIKVNPRFPQNLPNGPFQIDAPPVNGRATEVLPRPSRRLRCCRDRCSVTTAASRPTATSSTPRSRLISRAGFRPHRERAWSSRIPPATRCRRKRSKP